MSLSLKTIAGALGGTVVGRSVTCPGPGHSRGDRSLSVTLSLSAADGFVAHSFAGDDSPLELQWRLGGRAK
jgi:putative DNA primase/helicase